MRFSISTISERGSRPDNEDAVSFRVFGTASLAVAVADGLGGHVGGMFASRLAVETFVELAIRDRPNDLADRAKQIHTKILDEQRGDSRRRAMATTLSAAVFRSGFMEFVHCGDTRIVVARGAGVRRLTTDHSEGQRLFTAGPLTREQLKNYPRKNVLVSALGMKGEPIIDAGSFPVLVGDRIFLTTDGLHNKIALRELLHLSSRYRAVQDALNFISEEMTNRNPDDNYTCAAVFALP